MQFSSKKFQNKFYVKIFGKLDGYDMTVGILKVCLQSNTFSVVFDLQQYLPKARGARHSLRLTV